MEEAMTHVIATEDPPLTPTRRRPYIYVYDMKPDYSTDYWQYRIEAAHCIYRWVLGRVHDLVVVLRLYCHRSMLQLMLNL